MQYLLLYYLPALLHMTPPSWVMKKKKKVPDSSMKKTKKTLTAVVHLTHPPALAVAVLLQHCKHSGVQNTAATLYSWQCIIYGTNRFTAREDQHDEHNLVS